MSIDIEIGMFPLHLHHRGVLLKMGKLLLGAAQAVSRRDKKKKKKGRGNRLEGEYSQSWCIILQNRLL